MSAEDRAKELAGYLRIIREKLRRIDKWNPLTSSVLNLQEVRVVLGIGTGGAMTMSRMADRLQLSVSSMTAVIDKLEKKKFVARDRQAEDRRVVEVTLTKAGRKFFDLAQQAHMQFMTEFLGALSASEQDTMLQLFRKVTANLK